jgi:hypothetical protein
MTAFTNWLEVASSKDLKFKPLVDFIKSIPVADQPPEGADKAAYEGKINSANPNNKAELLRLLEESWGRWKREDSFQTGYLGWISDHAAGIAIASVTSVLLVVLLLATLFTLITTELSETGSARGLITFLFAVGTIGIAIIVVLDNLISEASDREERFNRGKDILTILIGILGTIIGFYFGSEPGSETQATAPIQAVTLELPSDQLQANSPVTVGSLITGGTPPYTYSISFVAENGTTTGGEASQVTNTSSADGLIFETLTSPSVTQATPLKIRLDATESSGQTVRTERDVTVTPAP